MTPYIIPSAVLQLNVNLSEQFSERLNGKNNALSGRIRRPKPENLNILSLCTLNSCHVSLSMVVCFGVTDV
jgi:hypothetical protein